MRGCLAKVTRVQSDILYTGARAQLRRVYVFYMYLSLSLVKLDCRGLDISLCYTDITVKYLFYIYISSILVSTQGYTELDYIKVAQSLAVLDAGNKRGNGQQR